MLVNEARWIADRLADHCANHTSARIINIGSQDLAFRMSQQSFIQDLVFAPLEARADVSVVHADLFAGDGVDMQLDITDAAAPDRILVGSPTLALVSNLLEHVSDLDAARRNLQVVGLAGVELLVTGPRFFPFHADPIDNGYRPSRRALAATFPRLRMRRHHLMWASSALTSTAATRQQRVAAWRWFRNHLRRSGDAKVSQLRPVAAFGTVFTA